LNEVNSSTGFDGWVRFSKGLLINRNGTFENRKCCEVFAVV